MIDHQEGFRLLLNSSKSSSSGGNVKQSKAYNRGSLLASSSSSTKPAESVQADFKPRKIKKAVDSKYRDRAAERRGGANEYAEVEGLLEKFEKRMEGEKKEIVEEQRKYLGGDATHTVLVKGLDFALLEQQRAREESREDLDDDLESAFQGKPVGPSSTEEPSAATQTQGKKRTRAELLAELRQSREATTDQGVKTSTKEEEIEALERAKQAGKFKPMGSSSFAPVEKKKKKKKKAAPEQGQSQAKETKASPPDANESVMPTSDTSSQKPTTAAPDKAVDLAQDVQPKPQSSPAAHTPAPTLAPPAPAEDIEDADPFGDVGDYEPDYGDDSDTEAKPKDTPQPSATSGRRNWFNDPEPDPEPARPPTPPPKGPEVSEPEPGPSRPGRLEGLMSSAMPSISDFLAADKEEEAREKKKARKEKNKKKAA
ncbi:hypothetical protein RhiXN_05020 [Rhizoctonia solani]|uniref:RED-like N-terminal domain-containing protein n=1 Tax=Rhizoctonia solani TaxID=456999 RepID=A0A8H8NRI5_9AGAM|nr:uncharacterized protein RhiXN_05020 [Rhizoctonia solani]QRW17018.1 hypothetical protein RhiXN_05020 [Rhizoctonia solani]